MTVNLTVATGYTDITPNRPIMLGGFVNRYSAFTSISDPLEANVLSIASSTARVLIVAIDALFPGRLLRAKLMEGLNLSENELFLAASHTHFAPMLSPGMPFLGEPDADYIDFVADQIVNLVRSLTPAPANFSYHKANAHHSMNRRLMRWRLTRSGLRFSCGLAPNPGGETDERISGLSIRNGDGEVIALLWNYACHPTAFPNPFSVSSDFPGVVRVRLRETFGDIPVLFLQGFSGDIRPPFYGTEFGLVALLRRILQGPNFREPSFAEWREWAAGLADCVKQSFTKESNPLAVQSIRLQRTIVPEEVLGSGGDGDKPVFWHGIDCGAFHIIGINGEMVTAYRRLIEPLFGDLPLFTAGCLDQTHGYLPIDSMVPEGGYEVEGFRRIFNYKTKFRSDIQKSVLDPLFNSEVL